MINTDRFELMKKSAHNKATQFDLSLFVNNLDDILGDA